MASISKQAIKKLVRQHFKATITDDGAAELARILENEAAKISRFAVGNAKKANRAKVTRDDVRTYKIKKNT